MHSAKQSSRTAGKGRASTSYTSASTSYPYDDTGSATTRPNTARTSTSTGRPKSSRPRTATSTTQGGPNDQQIICAISESRGISPVVGLAFVNLTTTEAVLCQISDNQTFVQTIHKLFVFQPSEILFMTTAVQPKSKMYAFVEANAANYPSSRFTVIDRKYWSETAGMDYIEQLAFKQDVEAVKVSVGGNFYATCCIAAVCWLSISFIFDHTESFPRHSSILNLFFQSPFPSIPFVSSTSLPKAQ